MEISIDTYDSDQGSCAKMVIKDNSTANQMCGNNFDEATSNQTSTEESIVPHNIHKLHGLDSRQSANHNKDPAISVSLSATSALYKNGSVEVYLSDISLWTIFNDVTNEMIVTRDGRRMFPVLRFDIKGLESNEMYKIELDFILLDDHRYKYMNGDWIRGSKSEIPPFSKMYTHPDSPNYGRFWMESTVAFSRTKITNKEDSDTTKIFLNSMYKYMPRIHIKKIETDRKTETLVGLYSFDITQFIAVTAYQNDSVTALKVKFNPFAKAFLEPRKSAESSTSVNEGEFLRNFYDSSSMYDFSVFRNRLIEEPSHEHTPNRQHYQPHNQSGFVASSVVSDYRTTSQMVPNPFSVPSQSNYYPPPMPAHPNGMSWKNSPSISYDPYSYNNSYYYSSYIYPKSYPYNIPAPTPSVPFEPHSNGNTSSANWSGNENIPAIGQPLPDMSNGESREVQHLREINLKFLADVAEGHFKSDSCKVADTLKSAKNEEVN